MPPNNNITSSDDVVAAAPPTTTTTNTTPATTTTANLQVQVGRYQDLVLRLRVLVRAMFDIQPNGNNSTGSATTGGTTNATTTVTTVVDVVHKGLLESEMMHLILYDMGLIYSIIKEGGTRSKSDNNGDSGEVDAAMMQRLGSVFTFCTRWYAQEILAALLIMSPHHQEGSITVTPPPPSTYPTIMANWWNSAKSKKATTDYLHTLSTTTTTTTTVVGVGYHGSMDRCYLSEQDRAVCRALYMQLVGVGVLSSGPSSLSASSSSSIDEVETSLQTTAATAALYPLLLPTQQQVAQEDAKTPAVTIISDIPNPHLLDPTNTTTTTSQQQQSAQVNVHTTELGQDLFVEADKTPEGRSLVERFRSSISHSLSSLLLHRLDGVFGLIRVLLLDDRVEQSFVHEAVRILVKVVVHGVATRSEDNFKTICRQVCGILRMQFSGTGLDAFGKSTRDVREEERRRLRLRGVGSEAVIERMLRQRDSTTGSNGNTSMDALDETLGFRLHLALTALCEALANHGHIHRGVPSTTTTTSTQASPQGNKVSSSASPQSQLLSPFERLSAINSTLLGPLFAPISLRRPSNMWLLKDGCGMVTATDRVDVLKGTPIVDEVLGALNGLHALLAGSSDATFGNDSKNTGAAGSTPVTLSSSSRRFIMMVLPAVLPALISLWSTFTDMKSNNTSTYASMSEGRLWGWYAVEMRLGQVWRYLMESPSSALSPQSEEIAMMIISAITTSTTTNSTGGHPRWQLLKRVVPVASTTPSTHDPTQSPPPVRDAIVVYASDEDVANIISSSSKEDSKEGVDGGVGKWEVSYPTSRIGSRGLSPVAVRALLGLSGGGKATPTTTTNNVPFVHKLLTLALESAVAEVFEWSNNKALLNTTTAVSDDDLVVDEMVVADTMPTIQKQPVTQAPPKKKSFIIEVMSSTNADGEEVANDDQTDTTIQPDSLATPSSAISQSSPVGPHVHRIRSTVDIVTAILDMTDTETDNLQPSPNILALLAGYDSPAMWTLSTLIGLIKSLCHIVSIIGEQLLLQLSPTTTATPTTPPSARLSRSISGLSCIFGGVVNVVMGAVVEGGDGSGNSVASAIIVRHLETSPTTSPSNHDDDKKGGEDNVTLLLDKVKLLMDWTDTLLSSTSNTATRCSSSSNSHSATLQGDGTSTTTQLLGVSEAVIKDAVEKIGGFGKVVRTCIESAEQHIRDNSSITDTDHALMNLADGNTTTAEKDSEALDAASKVVTRLLRPVSKIEARGASSTSSPWELAVCLRECAELVEELCDAKAFRNLSTHLLQSSTSNHHATSQMVNVLQRTALICLTYLVPLPSSSSGSNNSAVLRVGGVVSSSAAAPKPSSSTDLFVASSCVRILTLMLLQRLDGCGGMWLASMVKGAMEAALWALSTDESNTKGGGSCASLVSEWICSATTKAPATPSPAKVMSRAGPTTTTSSGNVAIRVDIAPASSKNLSSSSSKKLINLVGAQIKSTPKTTSTSSVSTVVLDTHQAGTLLCILLEVLVSVCDYDSTGSTIKLLDTTPTTTTTSSPSTPISTTMGVSLPITASYSVSSTDEVIGNRVFIQARRVHLPQSTSTTGDSRHASSSSSTLFHLLQQCVSVSSRHQANNKVSTVSNGDRRLLISAIYTLGSVVPLLHPRLSVPDVLDWIVSELFKGGGGHVPMMARAAAAAAVYRLAVSLVDMENAHAHTTLQSAQATGKVGRVSGAHIRVHGEQRPMLLPTSPSSGNGGAMDHIKVGTGSNTVISAPSVVGGGGGGSNDSGSSGSDVPRGMLLILRDLHQLGTQLANYKAPCIKLSTGQEGHNSSSSVSAAAMMEVENADDADEHHVHTIHSYGAAIQTLLKP